MKLIPFLLIILICSCSCLNYLPDANLMGSAQANSPELMIRINGNICRNGEGDIGLCSLKVVRGRDISITLSPLPYNYTFVQDCTDFISSDYSLNILRDSPFGGIIRGDFIADTPVFNCTFAVVRHDGISIFAAARFYVVSDKYSPLPKMYLMNQDIIIGEHGRFVVENERKFYNKIVKLKNKNQSVIVESESGRRGYHGF